MKHDSEWMLAILADLHEFCEENGLPDSRKAIEAAMIASRAELEKTAARDIADRQSRQPN